MAKGKLKANMANLAKARAAPLCAKEGCRAFALKGEKYCFQHHPGEHVALMREMARLRLRSGAGCRKPQVTIPVPSKRNIAIYKVYANGEGPTQKSIAKHFKISPQRVSQIIVQVRSYLNGIKA